MKIEELKELVETGREIEFIYLGRKHSITYGIVGGRKEIFFCEFYQDTTEVSTFEELLRITRYGTTVQTMIESVPTDDVNIY